MLNCSMWFYSVDDTEIIEILKDAGARQSDISNKLWGLLMYEIGALPTIPENYRKNRQTGMIKWIWLQIDCNI